MFIFYFGLRFSGTVACFLAQVVPALAIGAPLGSFCVLVTCCPFCCVWFCFLSSFLLFGIILYSPCSSPEISLFSKELFLFVLLENGI